MEVGAGAAKLEVIIHGYYDLNSQEKKEEMARESGLVMRRGVESKGTFTLYSFFTRLVHALVYFSL